MKNLFKKIIIAIAKAVVWVYCKIVYRLKAVGKENIPSEGALLFCGNHRTYLDTPLIIITSPRDMRFMAKEELKKNKFLAFLLWCFDGIYVKRDAKDIGALKEALKTLKSGNCIAIFPEGTRNGFEKNEGKMKNGAAYLALKTGAQIVPIGITGPAKPFTKNTIIYGRPLDLSEFKDVKKVDEELEEKVSEMLKEEILKLANIKE